MSAPLWFDNLAAFAVQTAILAAIGTALSAALRLRAPRVSLVYWQALLAACLLLPLAEPWKQTFIVLTRDAASVAIELGPAAASNPSLTAFPIFTVLALVLSAGFLFRMIRMVVGIFKLRGYSRRAKSWEPVLANVDDLRKRLAVSPVLLISNEIGGPVTYGSIRPVVLLPARFAPMDADCQRAIVCHELIHVSRCHWLFNLGEEIILGLFWFHPAFAWMVRRIRLAREQSVDSEVLSLTAARQSYLRALLDFAGGAACPLTVPAPEFMRENQLTQRVALMMQEASMSKPRLVLSLIAALAVLLVSARAAMLAFPLKSAPVITQAPAELVGLSVVEENTPGSQSAGEPAPKHKSSRANEGSVTPPLQPVHKVYPIYPPLAKVAKIEGTVELEITIAKNGEVTDVKPVSGHQLLVKAAEDAVRQWKYPSQPYEVESTVTVNFTLAKVTDDEAQFAEIKAKLARVQAEAGQQVSQQQAEELARQAAEIQAKLAAVQSEAGQRGSEQQVAELEHRSAEIKAKLARVQAEAGQQMSQQQAEELEHRSAEIQAKLARVQAEAGQQASQQQAEELARQKALLDALGAKARAGVQNNRLEAQKEEIALMKAQKAELESRIADAEKALKEAHEDGVRANTPKPVKTVAPVYPPAAKSAHIQGDVVLQVSIDTDGKVTDVEAESGPQVLVNAAVDAVRQWVFSNPMETAVTTTVTLNFSLADSDAKPPSSKPPQK